MLETTMEKDSGGINGAGLLVAVVGSSCVVGGSSWMWCCW